MDKESLRETYLANREALTSSQEQSKNLLISQRLIGYVPWHELTVVHLYLPIARNKEVDTFPLIQHLRSGARPVQIAVPKVEAESGLGHYFLTRETKLVNNVWGIPEPVNAKKAPIEALDLVVVPMLIFDKSGHRIGYGKGYYDRFLAQCKPSTKKVGLCYFDPVEHIDVESTDVPMDAVVTPDGIWEF